MTWYKWRAIRSNLFEATSISAQATAADVVEAAEIQPASCLQKRNTDVPGWYLKQSLPAWDQRLWLQQRTWGSWSSSIPTSQRRAAGNRSSTPLLMTQSCSNYGQPYVKDCQRVGQTFLNHFTRTSMLETSWRSRTTLFLGVNVLWYQPAYARSLWQLCTAHTSAWKDASAEHVTLSIGFVWQQNWGITSPSVTLRLSHHTEQSKEPLLQHKVIAGPWAKVAADLCELDNRTLLVITDSVTSRSVIKEMKAVFTRYGIPDVLVTDNGPQFAAAEFVVFAKSWMFQHITSSPHYSQSNGKAENAVKMVKRLFTKCKKSGQSEFLVLLDWRNTPTEGVGTSPAQRLMGRRCKILLPIASTLLQPRYSTDEESHAIMGTKERQRYYYNKHTKPLQPILQGETVRMKLPGQKVWSAGTCLGSGGPCSYNVRINGSVYRHNRRQLVRSKEPPIPEVTQTEPVTLEPSSKTSCDPVTQDQEPATTMPGLRRSQWIRLLLDGATLFPIDLRTFTLGWH